jgi:hypothetical protein
MQEEEEKEEKDGKTRVGLMRLRRMLTGEVGRLAQEKEGAGKEWPRGIEGGFGTKEGRRWTTALTAAVVEAGL